MLLPGSKQMHMGFKGALLGCCVMGKVITAYTEGRQISDSPAPKARFTESTLLCNLDNYTWWSM